MEIDFLYYMKVVAISTLTFVIYRLFVEEKKDKTKDHYSRPGKYLLNALAHCISHKNCDAHLSWWPWSSMSRVYYYLALCYDITDGIKCVIDKNNIYKYIHFQFQYFCLVCNYFRSIFSLIFSPKSSKINFFILSAWNFFLKKIYARHVINKEKKRQQKILKELRNYESESPKILPNENSSDSQQIYGVDHDGNSLLVKFTRKRHRIAEIWLILRVKNGNSFTTYTLPG